MCNKLLSLLMLVFVIGGVVIAGTAEPNLVAFYRFNETSGTTANDYSGNGYNGTVGSSSGWDSTGFYGNGCLYFNGTFNVAVPDAVVSGLSDEVTVSLWVKSDDPGTYANALFWGVDSSYNRVLGVELPGGYNSHLWFHAGYGSGSWDTYPYYNIANVVTFRGQWNNFTFTKDASAGQMKIYINGVLIGTLTGMTKTMENIVDFVIGTSWDGTWAFQGRMADFRLYDRVLCEEEIADLAGTNLVGWWKFEETSGTTAYDSSSYRHNGTLGYNNSWDDGVVFTGDDYGASKVGFTSADATEIFSTVDDQVTVAFWAKNDFANSTGNSQLFTGKNSSNTVLLSVELPTGLDDLVFKAGSSQSLYYYDIYDPTKMNYLPMEQWHHYALVKDAGEGYMKIYVNGYLVSQETGKTASMAGIVNFELCGNTASWHEFAGTVKDFRIYDKALDRYEIEGICGQYENEFNNVYYVDAVNGNDNNAGTSPGSAWQSVNKVNSITFQPLDKIMFKAGCVWSAVLTLHGSGSSGEPIVIDAYGDISNENNKPRINAGGNYEAALRVYNVDNWEINNLQLTNLGATRAAYRRGISVRADNYGVMRNIKLKNLYVHSVNGLLDKFQGGGCGIDWAGTGSTTKSRLDGLLIEGCHVKTTDRDGIIGGNSNIGVVTNAWPRSSTDWFPNTHVLIRGNFLEDIGGDGIVPVGSDGAIVEYNLVDGAACRTYTYATKQTAVAIWPWSADNTIIQYNEVTGVKGTWDGQAFDSDYNTSGSIFQYNYSHNNEGGFLLVCTSSDGIGNIGTVVRYNISQNDLCRSFYIGAGITAYNNVIYNGSGSDQYLIYMYPDNTGRSVFTNNIFMSLGTSRFTYAAMDSDNLVCYKNCWRASSWKYRNSLDLWWNNGRPSDPYAITSDPKFVSPGSGGDGLDSVDGYKLQSTSPCLNTGFTLTNNGGIDYWGNELYNSYPDVGAYEKP